MRYHLLIDADDTLWENNIYFEQAIHAFITFLDHSRLTPEEVRAVLDEVEPLMGVDPQQTWMVGNSPRSDINPALAAGLNAVYIPHPHTWRLEHEEVESTGGGRLLTLSRFADLRTYF